MLFYKKKKKPLLICIHGFGKRTTDEYANLVKYFEKDCEIIVPKLFDQTIPEDRNWEDWVKRAMAPVLENKNRDVYLIGYSMGGVIASYIAMKCPNVKKLFLLAPAFSFLNLTTAKRTVKEVVKPDKYYPEYPEMTADITRTFMSVVNNCKDSIKFVTCPVFFFHCMKDNTIPYTVSEDYRNFIKHDNTTVV